MIAVEGRGRLHDFGSPPPTSEHREESREPGREPHRPVPRRGLRNALRNPMVRFSLAGAVAFLLLAWASAVISRRAGTTEAVYDAIELTRAVASGVIEPNVTPELLAGDPVAIARFDDTVRSRVLSDSVVRVKLWNADGVVVYSDEPKLIGSRFELSEDELALVGVGAPVGQVSDVASPENLFERDEGELMEVYQPLISPDGNRLVYESYYRLTAVDASSRRIWLAFVPIILGALGLLQAVQFPLAWSLNRRVRRQEEERARLLERALAASETERRNIAGDLHDGVIQDLVGVAYALAAGAEQSHLVETKDLLGDASDVTRRVIRSLRTFIVDLYPPDLAAFGLEVALEDLVDRTKTGGMDVTLEVTPNIDCPPAAAALIYRTSLEALRNAVKHSRARSVILRLRHDEDGTVRLDIVDDGVGFDVAQVEHRRAQGHVGLHLMAAFAEEAGAVLEIDSAPEAGTRITLKVGA